MKNVLFALVALGIVAATSCLAEEIPFGVSPKQISVSGAINFDEPHSLGLSKGKLTQSYEYKIGNRTGVKLSGLTYTLRFWNVGEMGGTSGYLFWKKDFGRATLNLEYEIDTPGQMITEVTDTPMGPAYKMEPAEDIPSVDGASCFLRFTGGPAGTFKGTCSDGVVVEGRIGGAGSFAIFEKVTQPEDPAEQNLALALFSNAEMRLNGEFGDWKFDDSTLEDSGARFSSLNGEINVRHENDTKWQFGRINTVLYVLDHVKTEEDSTAILSFTDLSTFLVKPESEIVVTTPPKKDSKIKLVAGNIYANVKKMLKDGTMEVEMSQAVAGIKGTRFELSETGTESTIAVTEGTVAFRSIANGSEVMVSAGETVTATASGLGEKSTFDAAMRDAALIAATTAPDPSPAQPATENTPTQNAPKKQSWLIPILALLTAAGSIYGIARVRRRTIPLPPSDTPQAN